MRVSSDKKGLIIYHRGRVTHRILSLIPLAVAFVAIGCDPGTSPTDAASSLNLARTATVSVFATGLQYPRGLTFGPDGTLYVAEAGRPAPTSRLPNSARRPIRRWGPITTGRRAHLAHQIGTGIAHRSPRISLRHQSVRGCSERGRSRVPRRQAVCPHRGRWVFPWFARCPGWSRAGKPGRAVGRSPPT